MNLLPRTTRSSGLDLHPVTDVLITVAGSDRKVLGLVPTDVGKQAGMGAAIIITALLATASATVAFTMAFDVFWLFALVGGLLWGFVILNLDRWLVVSSPRQATRRATLAMATPRLVLAVIIGMVVSTPLTLVIFEDEIATQLEVIQAEAGADFERQMLEDPRFASLEKDKARVGELQQLIAEGAGAGAVLEDPTVKDISARLATKEKEFAEAEQAVTCEKEGTCGSGQVGAGPASADKERRRDRLAGEVAALTTELADAKAQAQEQSSATAAELKSGYQEELATLQAKVADTEDLRSREIAAHDGAVANADGLLARLEGLHVLEQRNSTMRTAHWVFFLFLTAMESLPVLFKTFLLLGKKSGYERAMDDLEAEHLRRLRRRLKTVRQEAVLAAEGELKAGRDRVKRELAAERAATEILLEAQLALTQEAVDRWALSQREAVREAVDPFLDELKEAGLLSEEDTDDAWPDVAGPALDDAEPIDFPAALDFDDDDEDHRPFPAPAFEEATAGLEDPATEDLSVLVSPGRFVGTPLLPTQRQSPDTVSRPAEDSTPWSGGLGASPLPAAPVNLRKADAPGTRDAIAATVTLRKTEATVTRDETDATMTLRKAEAPPARTESPWTRTNLRKVFTPLTRATQGREESSPAVADRSGSSTTSPTPEPEQDAPRLWTGPAAAVPPRWGEHVRDEA